MILFDFSLFVPDVEDGDIFVFKINIFKLNLILVISEP